MSKIQKGTEEFQMFQDFWQLAQKYWIPEKSDSYWNAIVKDCEKFAKQYKSIPMSACMASSILITADSVSKGIDINMFAIMEEGGRKHDR